MSQLKPDLSERAQHMLRALIERYTREGQPVGSRTLAREAGLNLSPATIRNVMSGLEKKGLVVAPHTSAGRIPTEQGLRLFVDNLLEVQPIERTAHGPPEIAQSALPLQQAVPIGHCGKAQVLDEQVDVHDAVQRLYRLQQLGHVHRRPLRLMLNVPVTVPVEQELVCRYEERTGTAGRIEQPPGTDPDGSRGATCVKCKVRSRRRCEFRRGRFRRLFLVVFFVPNFS